jgi:hypothetical protein
MQQERRTSHVPFDTIIWDLDDDPDGNVTAFDVPRRERP